MLTLNNLSYIHPNGALLFESITLAINQQDKVALIGNNGVGKSTLLKIIAGGLTPSSGVVVTSSKPYYVPQHFGQFNNLTIAQSLRIDEKLSALKAITDGHGTETDLGLLNDDWLLEERCDEALAAWKLEGLDLNSRMDRLSGGQKTKVFLAGTAIHQPAIVLLDEPSNHLDDAGRTILYDYIKSTTSTLVVVSHDKSLLDLLNPVCELSKRGIMTYGGNYEFYAAQKEIEANAMNDDLKSKEKALRKAREIERESLERKQKLDARGKRKQAKAGLPRISMNTFKNKAEKSTSKIKDVHNEKIEAISEDLSKIRKELPVTGEMKIDLDNSKLHIGKRLIDAKEINAGYSSRKLWRNPLTFSINSGERIVIKGNNGSGKTTLIKIILGKMEPTAGTIGRAEFKAVYIDQDYTTIDNRLTVYGQVQQFNDSNMPEHELKIRLNRFLFSKEYWDRPCSALSGGEKMRLTLCCIIVRSQAPDIIVLDEPTNNLDMHNIRILINAIHSYQGTLIAVSHDRHFLEQVNIQREIILD